MNQDSRFRITFRLAWCMALGTTLFMKAYDFFPVPPVWLYIVHAAAAAFAIWAVHYYTREIKNNHDTES